MTMGDVNVGSAEMRNFKLGTPALVCRWRLASGRLPLENRHLRALGRRSLDDEPISPQLIAWAKQHVEWTLRDGSAENPNGVLMLIIDEEGQAAMTVGPYEPLAEMDAAGIAARALAAQREAEQTSVAPETLWVVRDGCLVAGVAPSQRLSGASSLVEDLAKTVGLPLSRQADLAEALADGTERFDEAFLVSDEHGIVCAADAAGPIGARLAKDYVRLLESMDKRR